MIDRRKIKGTILQRKDYDYARHNTLRVTHYDYKDSGIAEQSLGASDHQCAVQDASNDAPPPQNTWNGQRIRSLRKRLNMSGRTFAEALGLTGKNCQQTVYLWETDKKLPSMDKLAMMENLSANVT